MPGTSWAAILPHLLIRKKARMVMAMKFQDLRVYVEGGNGIGNTVMIEERSTGLERRSIVDSSCLSFSVNGLDTVGL